MNNVPFPPILPEKAPKAATVVHRIATALLWIAYLLTLFLASCTLSHSVTQSSVNKSTGDSIVIRYEQVGRSVKKVIQ